jgi:hypothetical protein
LIWICGRVSFRILCSVEAARCAKVRELL